MANIYSVVIVWLSLFTICYSLTVTGSRDDEREYEDFADIESYTGKKPVEMKVPTKSREIEEYGDEAMEMQEEDNNGITNEDAMKNGFMQDDEEGDNDDNQIAKQQQDGDGDNTVVSTYGGAYEQEVDEELKANLQARTTANVIHTQYRANINFKCNDRYGIYWVKSTHNKCFKDRAWTFRCRYISSRNFQHCYYTGYINKYDGPLVAHCRKNYIVNGIKSIYHNVYGDRKFSFLCCRASKYVTKLCSMSKFVNSYRGLINYSVAAGRVFTGAYSYHSDANEDRRWGFASCSYSR